MSKALGKSIACGLLGALAGLTTTSTVRAEVSADLSGSILVFPKVIWDGTRDTVIQIANTSNNMVHAHCFYVNAQPANPAFPVSVANPRRWQETDFEIWLTKQQPTHWVASQGRQVNPNDVFGSDGAGLDPGAIPPVPEGFEGDLRCVQVDASGTPFAGNNLKGEALLRSATGDVSKYNGIAVLATGQISNDNTIRFDNPINPDFEGEANSCHNALLLNHFVDGTPDPALLGTPSCVGDNCPITTEITLVPCSQDLENLSASQVTVQFEITDEMELNFSASTTVDCWMNFPLSEIASVFTVAGTGGSTGAMFTKIRPVDLDGGVFGIAEETHSTSSAATAVAAWNLQGDGQVLAPDGIESNFFVNGRFFPVSRYDATLNTPGGPVVDTMTIPEF